MSLKYNCNLPVIVLLPIIKTTLVLYFRWIILQQHVLRLLEANIIEKLKLEEMFEIFSIKYRTIMDSDMLLVYKFEKC